MGIRAGQLNRRCTFLTRVAQPTGDGGYLPSAASAIGTVPNVWASLEPLRGAELVAAQQEHADARFRLVTRWRNDLLTTYAVSLLDGSLTTYYQVVSLLPRRMERTLAIDVRQVTAAEVGL
jgi:SPP1 family predicted phage head-tail adaptor